MCMNFAGSHISLSNFHRQIYATCQQILYFLYKITNFQQNSSALYPQNSNRKIFCIHCKFFCTQNPSSFSAAALRQKSICGMQRVLHSAGILEIGGFKFRTIPWQQTRRCACQISSLVSIDALRTKFVSCFR